MKTSELIGPTLDWAVAKSEFFDCLDSWYVEGGHVETVWHGVWTPSTDWSQGGPIIKREFIDLVYEGATGIWEASTRDEDDGWKYGPGPTPLIAAMRCYVASKLGDEVDVPEELQ